jgi:amino acid permease
MKPKEEPLQEPAIVTDEDRSQYPGTDKEGASFHEMAPPENYQTLGRWRACVILITIEVGIGILSLPSALHVLGLIPGIIAIIGFGLLSTYCGYVLLQFFRVYPMVLTLVDCARYLGGKWFESFFASAFILSLCLICASANITLSIALNSISGHALCTVAFIAIPIIASWASTIPRKLGFAAILSWICTISIVSAVLIVIIALGVAGPQAEPGYKASITLVGKPTFVEAVNACLNIAFAFAGNQGFITVMAEMRDASRDFPPAFFMQKSFEIVIYVAVAAVIYALAGEDVRSPAIGSAPTIPAKIAYGVIIPCVLGTALVMGHTAIKYMFTAILRHLKREEQVTIHNLFTWSIWMSVGGAFWTVTFVVANAIPIFNSILNIIAALFISWFTFGLPAVFWLHLNWNQQTKNARKTCLAAFNWGLILLTLFLNAGGLYTALKALIDLFNAPDSDISGPFTCADNSMF